MKRFEAIDHPSDVGIIAYGKDLKELFENAAFGMFNLIGNVKSAKPRLERKFEIEGEDRESLLVNWLNELIYIEDSKKMMLVDFKVSHIGDVSLKASAFGEEIAPDRRVILRSVKAATYNQLEIKKEKDSWKAKIVFDV